LKINKSLSNKDVSVFSLKTMSNFLSSHKNIDNYEASIMWTLKRFYFTQRMLYNTQTLENLPIEINFKNPSSFKLSIYEVYQTKLQHNYNYAMQNVSFYRTILSTETLENLNYNLSTLNPNSNFTFSSLTSKELFDINDIVFIKFVFSNIFFKKNRISFFSIL